MSEFQKVFSKIYDDLILQIKADKYDFLRFNLIKQDEIKYLSSSLDDRYDTVIIIGFGASSLNVRALLSSKSSHSKKIICLDSLDQSEIDENLTAIDLSKSLFFSLSKSGNTNETYLLTKYVLEVLRISPQNLYVIAPFTDNLLFNLAKSFKANCFEHDNVCSGRFGIISNAALLPAAVVGIDVHKVVTAANREISAIIANGSDICQLAEYYVNQYSLNRHMLVLFNYCYQLDGLCRWQQQIIAESLGKQGFGITPIIARGTFDQHSQLQLYLEGPDDKFYKIITNNKQDSDMSMSLASHADNIHNALIKVQRPVILENFADIDEQIVTQQIIQTIMVTILIADQQKFTFFDQPSVDRYKKIV